VNLYGYIDEYLQHLRLVKGCTNETCRTYRTRLHDYHRWLVSSVASDPQLCHLSRPILTQYLHHLAGSRRLRPRTIRVHFSALRDLGRFLVGLEVLSESPAEGMKTPRLDAAYRALVTNEEAAALLGATHRLSDPYRSALARALLSVLIYGALRRAECLDLKVADVDLALGSVVVRQGKGLKSRTVYLCQDAQAALQEWMAVRPERCHHDWLWAYDIGRRVHYHALRSLLGEVKAVAGLADHLNIQPHSLRHNCATRLLENGYDLKSVSVHLGHSKVATTEIYIHGNEHRVRGLVGYQSFAPVQPCPRGSRKAGLLRKAGRR
jgi:site-specific recombinase XerD